MKKILSVILTVVMIASMFASVVVVNAADKLTIKVDTVEAKPGDTVDVKIDLVNNVTVSSVCLTVSWSKGLTLTNANYDIYNPKDKSAMVNEPDEVDEDYNAVWTGVTSPFVFNWVSGKSEVKDDCTFVTLTFKVADDAAGELAVTAEAKNGLGNNDYPFDKDGNTIPFEIVNGAVKTPEAAIVDTYVNYSLDSMLASGKESKKLDTVELKKGDTMTILGWALFTDLLKEMVYTIDGEEHACEDVYRDRNDASPQYGKHAGFGLDDNFMDLLGVDSLDLGTYAITIIARANGGFEKVIKTFTLKVVEELTPEDPGEPEFVHTVFDAGKVDNDTLVNAGGWTGGNYPITRFGYIVDGGAPVFAGVSLTELADSDPVKLPQNAGKYGVRFSAYFDLKDADLAPGRHTVQLVAEFADDAKTVLPLGNVASVVKNSFEVTIEGAEPVEFMDHTSADQIFGSDGKDLAKVGGNDPAGTDLGDITDKTETLILWGWYAATENIVEFGYRYEGEDPVLGTAKYTTEQAVIDASKNPDVVGADMAPYTKDASRFRIENIPVKDGKITLYGVAKLENGEIVDIWKVTYTNNYVYGQYTSGDQISGDNGEIAGFPCDVEGTQLGDLVGKTTKIRFFGWFATTEKIAEFGYRYEGEEPVLGYGKYTTEQAVYDAAHNVSFVGEVVANNYGDASRFSIDNIPLKEGEDIVVYAVAKLESGEIVDMWKAVYSNGEEAKVIQSNDNFDFADYSGDDNTYKVGGWTVVNRVSKLAKIGYKLDGGEVVWTANVTEPAAGYAHQDNDSYRDLDLEPAIIQYGLLNGLAADDFYGYRFYYLIDTSALAAGDHTFEVIGQFENGEVMNITRGAVKTFTANEPVVTEPDVTEPDVTEPETTEPTENPDNPKTSDVAVIALASVAAVALAGAFIGKKALKK